jgi:hypothetical protein
MRDDAGEYTSQEIIDFFESVGVKNYFSTAHEQCQNGLAEAAINSIMMAARTIMAESRLGCRFWFKAALAACDARNTTYKERIGITSWRRTHGEIRDIFRFRAFGCRAWVYLDSDRREKGKHTPRAVEAINLGFGPNQSLPPGGPGRYTKHHRSFIAKLQSAADFPGFALMQFPDPL